MIPYTTIPLISAFFLVFVGVLIGHFIWYRYRDEQELRANSLRRRIDELQSSLDIQTGEFTQANTRIAEVEMQLESAREENAELAAQRKEHETLYESAAGDLGKSEHINVELRDELNREAERRIEFERQAEQSQRQLEELKNSLSLLETDRDSSGDRISELTAQITEAAEMHRQLQVDVEQLSAEKVALQQQVEEREREIATLHARQKESSSQVGELSALQEQCERLSTMLQEKELESQSQREQSEAEHQRVLAETASLLKDNEALQKANAEYEIQLESQITLANDLSGKVSAALIDLSRLERNSADAQALTEDRDRLIDELDARQVEIQRLTADLDAACEADEATRQELARLRAEHEDLDRGLQDVSSRHEAADQKLQEQDRRRQSLERALASASEDVAQLQVERERLEGVEDEVVELDTKLRQALADLKLAKTEREEALTAESSTREIVAELRDELQDRLESVQALEQQKDMAMSTLESEMVQRQRVTEEMERAAADRNRLSSEVDALKQRDAEQRERLSKVSEEFEQLHARYEQANAQVKLYEQRLSDLEAAHSSGREDRKRTSILGRTAPAKAAFSFRQVQRKEDVVRAQEKTKIRHDEHLGVLFAEAPFRTDDLQHIHGITDAISQELNRLGVYTYKQIMEWDTKAIAAFAERVGSDRIAQQDWVGQARRLYHQQYRAAA